MSERNTAQLRKSFIEILIKHKEIEPKQQMERKGASDRKREGVKEGKQSGMASRTKRVYQEYLEYPGCQEYQRYLDGGYRGYQ